MTSTAPSRNGVPIRLTDERWAHIVEEHNELAGFREEVLETVSNAEKILKGQASELLAIRTLAAGRTLVVVYREVTEDDGFVITAFLTSRVAWMERREQVWPHKNSQTI